MPKHATDDLRGLMGGPMQVKVFEALKVPSDTARVSSTGKNGFLRV